MSDTASKRKPTNAELIEAMLVVREAMDAVPVGELLEGDAACPWCGEPNLHFTAGDGFGLKVTAWCPCGFGFRQGGR